MQGSTTNRFAVMILLQGYSVVQNRIERSSFTAHLCVIRVDDARSASFPSRSLSYLEIEPLTRRADSTVSRTFLRIPPKSVREKFVQILHGLNIQRFNIPAYLQRQA